MLIPLHLDAKLEQIRLFYVTVPNFFSSKSSMNGSSAKNKIFWIITNRKILHKPLQQTVVASLYIITTTLCILSSSSKKEKHQISQMAFKSGILGFLTLLCLFWPTVSQSSIPPLPDGFRYGEAAAAEGEGKVLIEAFFDPVCPDSRDSWPPLKKVVEEYASRVRLVVHSFPLPYHDNAFATSRALHITNKLKPSATYRVLEAFFHHQEQFYGKATVNKSKAVVMDQIVDFTAKALGSSYHSAIKSGFNDTSTDHATRFAFKYGCIRGVYGTPIFFVNGFPLPDAGSALNYKGWREVLDPLVSKKGRYWQEVIHSL